MSEKPAPAKPVVVVGAMNLDVIATAGQSARTDDSTPGQVGFYAGGVARNIAEGLTRLAVNTSLHSVVGDDLGSQLLALCQLAGMDTCYINTVAGSATPVYVSMNSYNGDLLHAVSDMSLIDGWSLQPQTKDAIEHAAYCVIDANLPQAMISDIAAVATRSKLVAEAVSASKCKRLNAVLPSLEMLKVNLTEATVLAGLDENVSAEVAGRRLLELGPRKVLMSLGESGALLFENSAHGMTVLRTPAKHAKVVSVNGAGDALTAGFLAAIIHGEDSAVALQWGATAASLSLECFSACSDALNEELLRQTP